MLSQYDYSIEYRRTADHGNADVLSRLPAGPDATFDGEESEADDVDIVCTIRAISLQFNPTDPWCFGQGVCQGPSNCKCDVILQGRMASKGHTR